MLNEKYGDTFILNKKEISFRDWYEDCEEKGLY